MKKLNKRTNQLITKAMAMGMIAVMLINTILPGSRIVHASSKNMDTTNKGGFEDEIKIDDIQIKLVADEGVVPKDAKLYAKKITNEKMTNTCKTLFTREIEEKQSRESREKNISGAIIFDIKLLNKEGNEVKPNEKKGDVSITFTMESMVEESVKDITKTMTAFTFNEGMTEATEIETKLNTSEGSITISKVEDSLYGIVMTSVPPLTNEIGTMVIKKGSETGPIVADLAAMDTPELIPGEEYYLCVTLEVPETKVGSKNFVNIVLGEEKTDGSYKANGLIATNIPGNTETPGEIIHDGFSHLLERIECPDIKYGSSEGKEGTANTYVMKDGVFLYQISDKKISGDSVYFAMGFKLDSVYWSNLEKMKEAIHIDMGTIDHADTKTYTNHFTSDIAVDIANKKDFYYNSSVKSVDMQLGKFSSAFNVSIRSETNSPMLYEEISYDVTYPADAEVKVSMSSSNMETMMHSSNGTLSISEKTKNTDGTVTQTVYVKNGYKGLENRAITYVFLMFSESKFSENNVYELSLTNAKVKFKDNEGPAQSLGKEITVLYKAGNADKVGQVTLTANNRATNATTGMGNVYNWNIGRDPDDLVATTSLLGSCNIKNGGTTATKNEKTYIAHFNTTNAQAVVNFVTIPVGWRMHEDDYQREIVVKYTGFDVNGNEISKETTVPSSKYRCNNSSTKMGSPYILLKAEELGIKSFKNVQADIGRLWSGYNTCSSANSNRFNSQASGVFGYFTSSNVGDVVVNSFELINTDKDVEVDDLSCTSKAESTSDATIYMNNSVSVAEKDSKIVAGDSVSIKEWTLDPYYVIAAGTSKSPGTNTSMILDPVVVLKLPKGISYSNLSFKKRTYSFFDSTATSGTPTDTENIEFDMENITYMNTTGDGTNLYKISFDKMVLGSFDENGAHSLLLMDITLNTDRLVTTTTYDFGDLVHLTSESYIKTTNYTSLNFSYAVPDTYHVNNGNDLSSGRAINADITGIAVQRLAEITVAGSISVSNIDGVEVPKEERQWLTYDDGNPNSVIFLGLKSHGQYRVVVNNPSTAIGQGFTLLLPIPKRNEYLGEMFQENPTEFDMSLSVAELPEGFKAEYITMEKMSDMNLTNVKYKPAEESVANAMIITAEQIGAGKYYEILFDFAINNETSFVDTGLINIFRSAFQYTLEGMEKNAVGSYVAAEIASSTISGIVFEDINLNGLLDTGKENGMSGITVTAKDTKGRVQIAETDEEGRYQMFQVREEKIILTMKVPEHINYRFSLDARNDIPIGSIGTMVTPAKGNQSASFVIPKASKEEVVNACVSQIQTVTYDKGTGAGQAPIAKEYRRGDTVTVVAPSDGMYKNGYNFLGWSKVAANAKTVDYIPGQSFIMDLDITLYAIWDAKDMKITFDYNGGVAVDPAFTSKTITYGKSYKQKDDAGKTFPENPTKEGWQFWKWELVTSAAEGTGNSITADSKVAITENMTLRAIYTTLNRPADTITTICGVTKTEDKPFYNLSDMIRIINDDEPTLTNKIEFSLVSGELPRGLSFSDDYSKVYGTPLEVTGAGKEVFIRVKARNGISHIFKLDIKVKPIPLTMVVTADPKASITLSDGKANVGLEATLLGLDTRYPLTGQVAFHVEEVSKGSTLLGSSTVTADGTASITWTITKSGLYDINVVLSGDSGGIYQVESVENVEGYVVADEPLVNHLVTFDVNGTEATLSTTQKYVVEDAAYGNLPIPVRSGYEFAGWYTDSVNGTKVSYSSIVNLGKTEARQILYAHWNEKRYTVMYETNSTISVGSKTTAYHEGGLLPLDDPEKKGYTFKEWILKGSEMVVTDADMYYQLVENDNVRSITLVAVWTPNAYTVLYDGNGGSVSARSIRVTYGSSYGKLITPLRTGYEFNGWMDQFGKIVTDSSMFYFTQETTLTAQWKVKSIYSVIYNSNGGSLVAGMDMIGWNAKSLGAGKEPVREGYRFAGWKHGNTIVTESTSYGVLAVMETVTMLTLVAQWEPIALQVSFDLNLPAGVTAEPITDLQTVFYGREYNSLPVAEVKGYTFAGWYTSAKGGAMVTPASIVTELKDHTLYARWWKEYYSVTYPSTMTGYQIISVDGEQNQIKEHGTHSFQLHLEEGYDRTNKFAVKVKKAGEEDNKAVEVPNVDGIYTLSDIQDDLIVVIDGIDDITAPTLSISVAERKWDNFVSKVTFGLYSNQKQDVTIFAEDIGSKLAEVKYHISSTPLDEKQISSNKVSWTSYEKVFTLESDQDCYLYAKAMDHRGNITYVNSEGIVIDTVSPVLKGITSGETYYGRMQIVVEESHLSTLMVNGLNILQNRAYGFTLVPSDEPYTITVSDIVGNSSEYQIMVKKATPKVNPVFMVSEKLMAGDSLLNVDILCSKGDTEGSIAWVDRNCNLTEGKAAYEWIFVPKDAEAYHQVSGVHELTSEIIIQTDDNTDVNMDTNTNDSIQAEHQLDMHSLLPEVIKPTEDQVMSGNVVITIKEGEDEEKKMPTQFVDREQVIDACLSKEEKQQILNGANAEIRLEVKMLTDTVTLQEKEHIDSGIAQYSATKAGMVIDTYMELQLWKSINSGNWIRVEETQKDVTVKMEFPKKLQAKGVEYVIIESADNGYIIEEDQDQVDETITISTRYFKTCAIAHITSVSSEDEMGQVMESGQEDPGESDHTTPRRFAAFWGVLMVMITLVGYQCYHRKKKNEIKD